MQEPPVDGRFTLERLLGTESGHPLDAMRLERTRDGQAHSYVLVVRQATLGSGAEDALCLPHSGVQPRHALLGLRGGRFVVAALREDAPVALEGRGPLPPGVFVELTPGAKLRLGTAELVFSDVVDADMKSD